MRKKLLPEDIKQYIYKKTGSLLTTSEVLECINICFESAAKSHPESHICASKKLMPYDVNKAYELGVSDTRRAIKSLASSYGNENL